MTNTPKTHPMNVLIVDDELPAREELKWLLEQCDDVAVIGDASTSKTALEFVQSHPVDLVFCDIDMPGANGMRLAESLSELDADDRPLVAFVTAYDRYAVDAFGVEAIDYVLKPVRLERLQKTLARAAERLETDDIPRPAERPARPLARISVEERGVYRVIPVDTVLFFESEDGIVVAQTDSARFITDFSLKFLEQNLDPDHFFRSHRSYIVRLDAIDSIAPWGAGTYRLILDRDADLGVPLARSRAAELKALIPWSTSALDNG
jgi:DNA-binding LytR/AlgR family response regulator